MAVPVAPRNLGQQVALQMGWSGEGLGAGGHTAWVNSLNPQQREAYTTAMGMGTAGSAPVSSTPMFTEPLTDWEKQGLTQMSQGVNTTRMADILSQLRGMIGKTQNAATGQIEQGTAPVTMDEILGRQNPFASNLKNQASETANKIRALVTANQGVRGARSFGDTATGVRLGEVDTQQAQAEGNIDYQTFADALAQINQERNRNITGAGAYNQTAQVGGALAGDAFGMAESLSKLPFETGQRRVNAGQYVRQYNQGVNDQIQNDILAQGDSQYQKIMQALEALKSFDSGMTTTATNSPSTGERLGGGGAIIAKSLPTLFPQTFAGG